jgi:two-component system phosphate regulon sensor histidine kinase PhoR
MVVLHDVTAAQKADQMRADFVANVSHELRSPLTALLGFIETLRGPARDDPETSKKFLEIMEAEALRMTRLINDLLTLSKVETEEHIRPRDEVALGMILAQVTEILSVQAKEQKMEIVLESVGQLPSIPGESDELIQVFQNLIANAISYGRPGTAIRVETEFLDKVPESEQAGISVAVINEGDGVPLDDIPRLTERFYRADKGRSRSMGGTGLGLAIVKHIIARHRGHLEIQSTPGHITSFIVSLPIAKS